MILRESGSKRRGGADVRDIAYDGGRGGEVEAYLVAPVVQPPGGAAELRPGVVFAHWFDPEAPDGNRSQFVDEAVALASDGVVSLLPQGRFPWSIEPSDAASDRANVEEEVERLRHGLDLLVEEGGVDPGRLAVVGHDFGGMVAAILASVDRRPRGYVLVAATPRWGDWFLPFWPIGGDRFDYLRAMSAVDPIAHISSAAPAELLFQFARDDFFIAAMTGREFARAASEPKGLRAYDADHAMRSEDARADRRAFLRRVLGLVAEG